MSYTNLISDFSSVNSFLKVESYMRM